MNYNVTWIEGRVYAKWWEADGVCRMMYLNYCLRRSSNIVEDVSSDRVRLFILAVWRANMTTRYNYDWSNDCLRVPADTMPRKMMCRAIEMGIFLYWERTDNTMTKFVTDHESGRQRQFLSDIVKMFNFTFLML